MRFLFYVVLIVLFTIDISAQEWQTNFNDAKQEASSSNKNILLVFQGSDWCAPCIKLDKEIWSTKEFQELSKDHFVMLKADFPRRKANKLTEAMQTQNNSLAELYNKHGYFPLVVVLDSKGKVLGKMGYEQLSPKAYYNKLSTLK